FPAVSAGGKIGAGSNVSVIEAKSRWTRREDDAATTMCRNERRAFFGGPVHIGGNRLAMPMQLLGRVGFVDGVHHHLLSFFKAEQRAGKLIVVRGQRDDAAGRDLNGNSANSQRVVGLRLPGLCDGWLIVLARC